MTIIHTPWSAMVHIGLTTLGFYLHRNVVHTAGGKGVGLLVFGPGAVGLVEPLVSRCGAAFFFFLVSLRLLGAICFPERTVRAVRTVFAYRG